MTKNEAIITGFSNVDSILTVEVYCPPSFYCLGADFFFFEKYYNVTFFPARLKPYNIISSTPTSTLKSLRVT